MNVLTALKEPIIRLVTNQLLDAHLISSQVNPRDDCSPRRTDGRDL